MKPRLLLLALACAACLTLSGVRPAAAQVVYQVNPHVISGTIQTIGPNSITLATNEGWITLPTTGTTFISGTVPMQTSQLYVGLPIQATLGSSYAYHTITRNSDGSFDEDWSDDYGHYHVHHD